MTTPTTPTIRSKYQITECDNCSGDAWIYDLTSPEPEPGEEDKTISPKQYVPVMDGYCLDLTGHYGGFSDSIDGALARVILCHDCSVALARALPGIFPPGSAHHSMFADEDDTSCCEFAWRSDPVKENDDILVGDGKGAWVPREQKLKTI